jgi:hypothetical protein
VHQLVLNNVTEMISRTIIRNDHPALKKFEKTSDAFGDKSRRRVGLFKMKMSAVEDERDTMEDGRVELLLKDSITPFGKIRALSRESIHPCVEVDFEMLGAHDLPLEIRVVNLVPAKIIELRRSGGTEKNGQDTIL